MDLKNVYTFVTVARKMSFAETAHFLHLSQPSVTSRIQTLEQELGKSLFIRSKRAIKLTKEGEAFLPYALKLLEIESIVKDKLSSLNVTLEGKVTIGATALWSVYILPAILGNILKNYPGIELQMLTGNTVQITQMLMQDQIDIGLVSSKVKKQEVKQYSLSSYELSVVCSPDHSFAERKVDMKELLKAPMVTYQQKSDAWSQIRKIYSEHGATLNVVMELNQIEAAKQMVRYSSFICILPTISIKEELEKGLLKKVEVTDFPPIKENLSIITLERKESYQIVALLMDHLKETIGNQEYL
ncbi:LysR family transcriptional regulator [Niallia endozanthoxylica]|uniref:LysR family transcriptional regulator n=1 Tax=Niallia endozanthoxylica TaxID=2036016 RepID=A0A5J5HQ47_9BACI|nr:LysR family transcriptional regulator [Niallia endozanthoxylica]KAA9022244.1 LysR family transcriptional regulator [Niallia endozanthoxylica]